MVDTPGGEERTQDLAQRLGIEKGMVVQEVGWDEDCDSSISEAIEDVIGEELLMQIPMSFATSSCCGGGRKTGTLSTVWWTRLLRLPTAAASGCLPLARRSRALWNLV